MKINAARRGAAVGAFTRSPFICAIVARTISHRQYRR